VISRCPFCHEDLCHDLGTVCASCLARHHDACWDEAQGRCAACKGRAALVEPRPPRTDWVTQALRVLCVTLALVLLVVTPRGPEAAPEAVSASSSSPALASSAGASDTSPSPDAAPAAVEGEREGGTLGGEAPQEQSCPAPGPEERARAALRECRWVDALSALEQVLASEGRPELWAAKAHALRGLGAYTSAVQQLDRALEATPEALAWRLARAELLLDLGRIEAALEDYRFVLARREMPRISYRLAMTMAFWSGVTEPERSHWLRTALDQAEAHGWIDEAELLRACLAPTEPGEPERLRWIRVGTW
jgi:tetratricopeptide (TPR) repeat protein